MLNNTIKQIGYLQQPDGSVVMVNLANTVTTSPVKQTQSTGKLININESALLQQARIYRYSRRIDRENPNFAMSS